MERKPPQTHLQSLINDSIHRFIPQIRARTSDLSALQSVFLRLLHSSPDPPLEALSFYSALAHYQNLSLNGPGLSGRISALRDLLHLLTVCSVSCGGEKSIALLFPLVYELHRISLEVETSKEVYLVAEGVCSYVGICCGKNSGKKGGFLGDCFVDLVGVWREVMGGCGDSLGGFFPVLGEGICDGFRREECPLGFLSGAVVAELFFVVLRLKLRRIGGLSSELRSDLMVWVVGSLTGFRSSEFFGILLMLLLDGALPSSLLLEPAEESFLRDILYDSVILVDYPFIYSHKIEENNPSSNNLFLSLLFITHQAIQSARARGDQNKVKEYSNAFSRMTATQGTPEPFLKSILNLEDLSKLRQRLFFEEKTKKTLEEDDTTFLSFVGGTKKRKGSRDGGAAAERPVKFKGEETSGESDVENPTSDEEMEDSD